MLITSRPTVQCTERFTVQHKDGCTIQFTVKFSAKKNTKCKKESVLCRLGQITQSL